ncbi:MAG: TniB family NTP-binding protein [Magnetovibrio sp.]|nr:TniB family NTP-binding protein [Magnetovibrio sp.]
MGDHLAPKAKAMLTASEGERLQYVMAPKWIGYARAKEALSKLEDLLVHPKMHRMPNLMIHGPTNNGKTMIIQRFMRDHPHNDNPDGDAAEVPVLTVQMPFSPEPRRFYRTILEQLFATYRSSDNLANLETQAIRLLRACGLRLLIIDELHNILAGRMDNQRQFLNLIRYLGNELEVPIVCLGIQSALRAIQIDEQLANRFEPFALPTWEDGQDFRRLLNSFEAVLPLGERSFLASDNMATAIMAKSEGTIGEVLMLLRAAAKYSIINGISHVNEGVLGACDYISPRERRRAAER